MQPQHPPNRSLPLEGASLLEKAAQLVKHGQPVTMCTIVRAEGSTPREIGARMLVTAEGVVGGTIGGGALELHVVEVCRSGELDAPKVLDIELDELAMSCGGAVSVFIEPLGVGPRLILFGAGHVAQALAAMAGQAGFAVAVVDDRADYLTAERFPYATEFVPSLDSGDWTRLQPGPRDYCVVVTREHSTDLAVLRDLVGRKQAYLGMIGSRRKVAEIFGALEREGVAPRELEKVHAPIGLQIGARTPAEIAVSILAQIIAVRRGREPE